MSDRLREALEAHEKDPYQFEYVDGDKRRRLVLAAARRWLAVEEGQEVDLVLDEYEGLYGFLGTDGFVVMPDEGRYLLIPVSTEGET